MNGAPGIPDPERPGRVLNPYDPKENPTFLPGDKVRDRRDFTNRTFRIIARRGYLDTELMILQEVADHPVAKWHLIACDIVPHLEMVAMLDRSG